MENLNPSHSNACCPHQTSQFGRWFTLFCDEPYRLFFPLGIFLGIIGASHWLWYGLGWSASYSGFFHSSIQTLGYINCFVMGFLMTSIPRFSSSNNASAGELSAALILTLTIAISLILGQAVIAESAFIGWLFFLIFFIVRRFIKVKRSKESLVAPPTEFVWIPIAVFHGLVGAILMIGTQVAQWPMELAITGKSLMQMGFLLSIVVGVGGFLAPRLMGNFEPIFEKTDFKRMRELRGRRKILHFFFGALLFFSFALEMKDLRGAYLVRAAVITAELILNRTWPRLPKVPDLFVKLLALSFWMIVVGSWALVFYPQAKVALMHFILIGGFSLMTFAVATMVTLSHGGEAQLVRKPLGVLWIVLIAILTSLALRIASITSAQHYFHILAIAASVWIVGAFSWLCFMAPRFLKAPVSKEEFERCHTEAKQRVQQFKKTF